MKVARDHDQGHADRRVHALAAGGARPRVPSPHRPESRTVVAVLRYGPALAGDLAFVYVYKALGAPDRFVGYVIMGGATAGSGLT